MKCSITVLDPGGSGGGGVSLGVNPPFRQIISFHREFLEKSGKNNEKSVKVNNIEPLCQFEPPIKISWIRPCIKCSQDEFSAMLCHHTYLLYIINPRKVTLANSKESEEMLQIAGFISTGSSLLQRLNKLKGWSVVYDCGSSYSHTHCSVSLSLSLPRGAMGCAVVYDCGNS